MTDLRNGKCKHWPTCSYQNVLVMDPSFNKKDHAIIREHKEVLRAWTLSTTDKD